MSQAKHEGAIDSDRRGGARKAASASPFDMPYAWKSADLATSDWLITLDDQAIREISDIAAAVVARPGYRLEDISHRDVVAPRASEVMAAVRGQLAEGCGFAVLGGLPFEEWDEKTACAASWLLCDFIATPVNQKWTGTRMYQVRDTGAKLAYGLRRSLTNLKQDFHTDGPWLETTANFMGLACVRQARFGGISRIASLISAHNWLAAHHPDMLARLYQPFYWDRQAEHQAGDAPASRLPIYSEGRNGVVARYYDDYVRNGYGLMQERIDEEGERALAALREYLESPENCFEFQLQPGQIFFLNNHRVAHARTAFTDAEGADRLLLRFWLRPEGGTEFEV